MNNSDLDKSIKNSIEIKLTGTLPKEDKYTRLNKNAYKKNNRGGKAGKSGSSHVNASRVDESKTNVAKSDISGVDAANTGVSKTKSAKKNTSKNTGTSKVNATKNNNSGAHKSASASSDVKASVKENSKKRVTERVNQERTAKKGSSNKSSSNKNNNSGKKVKTSVPVETLRVIPIGGLKEIGKNFTLIEYKNEILIIDCGFAFPEENMFGIDVVIPDFTYLRENREKLKGLIITHGHEDHIGGIPYLLSEFNIPIWASPLTLGLVKHKLDEKGITGAELNTINAGDVFHVGSFTVEAIRTNHSIADALAFSIKCPAGHIVHTGDFKVDYTPLDGKMIDLNRFAQLGDEGVDLLLADSTNVLNKGFTPSEKVVVDSINKIFDEKDKRIIIATFSSNIYRIKYFIEAAIKHGRKVAISGRSMENVVSLAMELGYLNIPETSFVDVRQINNIPDNSLAIITTGSQGEPMSALTRMANDNHKAVKLKKGDVVVFSSKPIPGNEKSITAIVNKLYEKQVDVVLSDSVDIHVSGHACQEELKLIHSLVKPRFFMPAHGEYRHLIEHANLAKSLGMDNSNVFLLSNGDSLVIKGRKASIEQNYASAEPILVDGYGIGDVGSAVLRDRKQLSEAGLIVICLAIERDTGFLAAKPELLTRGFIYVKDNGPLIEEAINTVMLSYSKCQEREIRELNAIKNIVRDDLRQLIYKKTKRNPVILPMILNV